MLVQAKAGSVAALFDADPALFVAGDEGEADAVEDEVDDRRGEERQHLGDDEAADDGDAERTAELGAGAGAEGERQAAEQRGAWWSS